MSNHKLFSNRGFTLVEMLIIAPIVVLVIGVFISALVGMTGNVLVVRGSNALSYNIQDALNRIDLDVKTSGGYLATNDITLTSPQGFNNDDTTVFHNADATNGTMLILKAYATTKNPLDPTKSYVYQSNQPKACSDQLVSQNSIVLFNVVYFVKNINGVNSLWRRVVAPSNYTTVGCSVPWQQPTCAAGYSAGFCLANDIKLVDGITSFGVNYYTSSDTVNPIADATNTSLADSVRQTAIDTASTVGITINATKKLAGRDISKSGTIRSSISSSIASFIPTDIAGLKLWLDASRITGKNDGDAVSTWSDSSGNGNNVVQATGASQPLYKTNIVKSRPVLRFTATNSQTMTVATNFPPPTTVIYVGRLTGGANSRMLSGLNNNWLLGFWGGFKTQAYFIGWVNNPSTAADTNWYIYSAVITASNSRFYENRNLITSSSGGVAGPNGLSLSGNLGTSEFSNGEIAEVIIYDSALSDTDREAIEAYLDNKYF